MKNSAGKRHCLLRVTHDLMFKRRKEVAKMSNRVITILVDRLTLHRLPEV